MNVITLTHPPHQQDTCVLALGFFDGLHLGHQAVLEQAKHIARAKQLPLCVMTFDHHPSVVFQPLNQETMTYLTDHQQKIDLFERFGVDILYIVPFTYEFSKLSREQFVDQYIIGLKAVDVVVGFDYTYGPPGTTSPKTLAEDARGRFSVHTVAPFMDHHEKISSTRIRKALSEGDMADVTRSLGRYYKTTGIVVHGEGRGRTLGYPTANLLIAPDIRLPKVGVYWVMVNLCDAYHVGMASIGYNITFGSHREKTVEVHIFDFQKMIYGEHIDVYWLYYARDEIKFPSKEALMDQLRRDEVAARKFFDTNQNLEVQL